MEVKLLHSTPLEIADIAICKCYGNEPHSDEAKVKARIHRVANVSKHSSVVEHLVICIKINYADVAQKFKENNFSIVTEKNNEWIISTNVRALQEIDLPLSIKHKLIPEEYIFLF